MELEEIKAGLIVKNKKTGILYMVIQSNISAAKEILLSDNELAQFYNNYTKTLSEAEEVDKDEDNSDTS